MFKKFDNESATSKNLLKTSVQRGIRSSILEQYPALEPYIDDVMPKKQQGHLYKCTGYITFLVINNEPLFYNENDGPWFPTLRLLHKYPFFMTTVQVDRGAIKFVLSGANIMCPGMTSKGGKLEQDFKAGTPVCIMAEGKEHPLAVGITKMTRDEIVKTNKGIGVDNVHYLNDGLWKLLKFD
jgi:PUA domain protein